MRRDGLVEPSGERPVICDGLVSPIAPQRIGPRLVRAFLGTGCLAFLGVRLAVGAFVLSFVLLGLLGAHLHLAAAVGVLGFGVIRLIGAFVLALPVIAALL